MNILPAIPKKQANRCTICGLILLKNERISGFCYRHYTDIPHSQRVALRAARGLST